ncbi:hypothetical protein FOMPIDRAFT_1033819 [Fomitopsis schrenkii]|uniref:Rhodanese domain-containing protein n=1 Tax=Fomitopsis schrenkii TaxID=2126942 RepID=S8DK17_FOMSC|nr:hypothetical protein FOMPIDRAFT_1033819 [Fomitopsis schrenkii]
MSSFGSDNISYPSSSSYGEVIAREGISEPLRTSTPSGRRGATGPQLTLDDVRHLTADSMAVRAIRNSEKVDGTTVGVIFTLSYHADEPFLGIIAQAIRHFLLGQSFLFAVGCPSASPAHRSPLFICGSTDELVRGAALLVSSKFLARITRSSSAMEALWTGAVRNLGGSSFDEEALWDSMRKASRHPAHALIPPPGSRSVDQLLSDARARLERLTPQQAYAELHDTVRPWPVILVDIRPGGQRAREGGIAGALIVERCELEWRFDPRSPQRVPVANRYDLRVIVLGQEGNSSSLAAVSLHDLGMLNATDVIGGYVAWSEVGLPMEIVRGLARV